MEERGGGVEARGEWKGVITYKDDHTNPHNKQKDAHLSLFSFWAAMKYKWITDWNGDVKKVQQYRKLVCICVLRIMCVFES